MKIQKIILLTLKQSSHPTHPVHQIAQTGTGGSAKKLLLDVSSIHLGKLIPSRGARPRWPLV